MFRKIISLSLTFCLLFTQAGFAQVAAVELNLSGYFSRMARNLTVDKFRPRHLRYLSYDALSNNFSLLLDKGDFMKGQSPSGTDPEFPGQELKEEAKTLLNYFFIGLALPNESFWVNLRPDSPESIIDDELAKTDIGKIFLEADLQLKKDTALFTSPQTPEGREYWDKLYKKAEELYGNENITIPTLTRPWIVPGEIIIRESKDNAYIYKATLKVMLESDYLRDGSQNKGKVSPGAYEFKDQRSQALNEYSSQLIRGLIIPKLTKEVNSSKRYAAFRQVYYSLILAQWFKQDQKGTLPENTLTNNLTGKCPLDLMDSRDLTNLASKEEWSKTTYFNEYKKSFAQGEYNIKEPVYTPTGQVIRSYFSGGIKIDNMPLTAFKIAGSPVGDKPYLVPLRLEKGNLLAAFPTKPAVTSSPAADSSKPSASPIAQSIAHVLKQIESTVFSSPGITTFRQCRIYRNPALKVIVKELIDNIISDGPRAGYYFKRKALKGYRLAQQRLGGVVIPFTIVDLQLQIEDGNNVSQADIENAVILNKVKDFDLGDKIKYLAQQGKVEEIKELVRQMFKVDHEIMKRGCYLPAPIFENFGVLDDGTIVLIDPGFLVSDDIPDNSVIASDWFLRGKSHHLNNIFLNSLKGNSLSDKEIKEIKMAYGEASGVYPMEFDDQYFYFFETFIKHERYYARGEQEFKEFYRPGQPKDAIPVLFAASSPAAAGFDYNPSRNLLRDRIVEIRRLLNRKNLAVTRNVTIFNYNGPKWGVDIVRLSALLKYLLVAAPALKITVVCGCPELIGLFPKVRYISPEEYDRNKNEYIKRFDSRTDLVIDFGYGLSRAYPQERSIPLINNPLTGISALNEYEYWHKFAKEIIGLEEREISDVTFQRRTSQPDVIFVNPNGQTSSMAVSNEQWVELINKLLHSGYSVALNSGEFPEEKIAARHIEAAVRAEFRDLDGRFRAVDFSDKSKLVDFMSKEVGAVLTIDTSIFHLSYRFGIPSVVITTNHSAGWIPEQHNNFRAIGFNEIFDSDIIGLLREMGIKGKPASGQTAIYDIRALAAREKRTREENLAKARLLLRKENLQKVGTITIFGFNNGKWGDDIVQTSMLIKCLLVASPGVKIRVVWDRPELAALFGERVESIALMDYLSRQNEFVRQFNKKTDIVIGFSEGLANRYPQERGFQLSGNMFVGTLNRYERWQRFAKEIIGIDGISDVIFKSKAHAPGVILINPHAVTQKGAVGNISWIGIIRKLLSHGFKVVLSEGVTPADEYRTEQIKSGVGDDGPLETIRKRKEDFVRYLSNDIAGVITADTAVFHLAYRFGIPAVVITNSGTNGWIPELQNNFHSIIAKDVDNADIVKALEELGVKSKQPGSPASADSAKPSASPLAGLDEIFAKDIELRHVSEGKKPILLKYEGQKRNNSWDYEIYWLGNNVGSVGLFIAPSWHSDKQLLYLQKIRIWPESWQRHGLSTSIVDWLYFTAKNNNLDFTITGDDVYLERVLERTIAKYGENVTGKVSGNSGSSPLGGIDMRHLAKNTVIQKDQSPPTTNAPAGKSGTGPDELKEIQCLIQAGIIPATRRLEECRGACSSEALLSCIADILRIEEERVTETEAGLKNLLASL